MSASFPLWKVVKFGTSVWKYVVYFNHCYYCFYFVILYHQQRQWCLVSFVCFCLALFLTTFLTETYYRLTIPSPPEGAFELQYGGPREGRPVPGLHMCRIWHFCGPLCLSGVYAKKKTSRAAHTAAALGLSAAAAVWHISHLGFRRGNKGRETVVEHLHIITLGSR